MVCMIYFGLWCFWETQPWLVNLWFWHNCIFCYNLIKRHGVLLKQKCFYIIIIVMYCQVWWPILEIGALHLTHPSAHTQQWVVNKHCEHAPGAVGSHCSNARGAIGGSVPCSRAPQSWYWRWRECCSFTIPTFNSCRCENRTSDLQVTSPTL